LIQNGKQIQDGAARIDFNFKFMEKEGILKPESAYKNTQLMKKH
jgi:hypothetical protein